MRIERMIFDQQTIHKTVVIAGNQGVGVTRFLENLIEQIRGPYAAGGRVDPIVILVDGTDLTRLRSLDFLVNIRNQLIANPRFSDAKAPVEFLTAAFDMLALYAAQVCRCRNIVYQQSIGLQRGIAAAKLGKFLTAGLWDLASGVVDLHNLQQTFTETAGEEGFKRIFGKFRRLLGRHTTFLGSGPAAQMLRKIDRKGITFKTSEILEALAGEIFELVFRLGSRSDPNDVYLFVDSHDLIARDFAQRKASFTIADAVKIAHAHAMMSTSMIFVGDRRARTGARYADPSALELFPLDRLPVSVIEAELPDESRALCDVLAEHGLSSDVNGTALAFAWRRIKQLDDEEPIG